MTAPIQEPTQGRIDQSQSWGVRQLQRRPAPPGTFANGLPWLRRSKSCSGTAQAVSSGSFVVVTWDSFTDDGQGYFGLSGDGIQVQSGIYTVVFEMLWDDFFTADANFWMGVDDTFVQHMVGHPITSVSAFPFTYSFTHRFNDDQVINAVAFQASGVTKHVDCAYMELVRIGSWTGTDPYSTNPDW